MLWSRFRAMSGELALAILSLTAHAVSAQSPITVTIEDTGGATLAGATATDPAGHLLGRSDGAGKLAVSCAAPCSSAASASRLVR